MSNDFELPTIAQLREWQRNSLRVVREHVAEAVDSHRRQLQKAPGFAKSVLLASRESHMGCAGRAKKYAMELDQRIAAARLDDQQRIDDDHILEQIPW